MALQRIEEWRLHVGAHKTATTHLQETLASRRAELLEQDVDFLPTSEVRVLRLPPKAGRFGWRRRLGWPMRRRFVEAVAPLREGPGRIVLSEENFLGGVRDLLAWPFYSRACARLRPFESLARRAKLHLFVSVRSFETLLPSAYAQEIRFRRLPTDFAPIRAAALREPPSWTELVSRISAATPSARLSIWRYEDYRAHDWRIMSHLCATSVRPGARIDPSPLTRTPSAAAVARIEAIPPELPRAAHVAAAEDIVARDASEIRFMPFTEDERAFLRERYAADLARLAERFPDALLKFP